MVDRCELTCVIADLGPGGAQRVLTTVANAWAERGRRITVITFSDPGDDFFQLAPEIARDSIGGLAPSEGVIQAIGANISRVRNLRRALRKSGARSVLVFLGGTNVLTIFAAAGLGLRVVISERNDPSRQSLGRGWDILRRRLYRYAQVVTANSRGALAALEAFVPRDKLTYIANPIPDFGRSDADTGARPRPEHRVLHIGRLTHQKGQDLLLRAFACALAEAPGWRLTIVGEGEDETALRALAFELCITDSVDWIERSSDLRSFYLSSSIFALPSRFEGTPNVLLEAMSAGLPVIVSDASSGPLEYVDDDQSGLVVGTEDVDGLAEALLRLMHHERDRRRLGQAARARVEGHDLNAVLCEWERVLQLSPAGVADGAR